MASTEEVAADRRIAAELAQNGMMNQEPQIEPANSMLRSGPLHGAATSVAKRRHSNHEAVMKPLEQCCPGPGRPHELGHEGSPAFRWLENQQGCCART